MSETNGDAVVKIAQLARAAIAPQKIEVRATSVDEHSRLYFVYPSEVKLQDVTNEILASLPNPQYKKGTVTLTALDSFGDFVNRMKTGNTVLFADAENRTLLAVFDYHDAINWSPLKAEEDLTDEYKEPALVLGPLPNWARYRAFFSFPQSRQYKTWKGANKKSLSQADLAAFIEDNVVDVMAPESLQDDKTKALVHQLGLKLAGPDKLLAVSRGLSIKADEQFTQVVNLNNGETQIVYAQTHASEGGADLKVPTGFVIAVPVFEGDAYYQLLVRLKYRKTQSAITWHFDIYNIDRAFDDAFEQSCSRVQDSVGLPLFYGSPET